MEPRLRLTLRGAGRVACSKAVWRVRKYFISMYNLATLICGKFKECVIGNSFLTYCRNYIHKFPKLAPYDIHIYIDRRLHMENCWLTTKSKLEGEYILCNITVHLLNTEKHEKFNIVNWCICWYLNIWLKISLSFPAYDNGHNDIGFIIFKFVYLWFIWTFGQNYYCLYLVADDDHLISFDSEGIHDELGFYESGFNTQLICTSLQNILAEVSPVGNQK